MIHPERIRPLNDAEPAEGRYVLYWMQQSQRGSFNPALEYAIRQANALDQPTVVAFGLMDDYPEANARHYAFLLQGLQHVERELTERGIRFVVQRGQPPDVALRLGREASVIVCDRGYLRLQKAWRREVAETADRTVVEVEGDVVVPLESVSDKAEHAARTLRPRLHRVLDEFLGGLSATSPAVAAADLALDGDAVDLSDVPGVLEGLDLDRTVPPVRRLEGGTQEARRRLTRFLRRDLDGYAERNEPADWRSSLLSPYLHFGQISPVEVALKVRAAASGRDQDREALLEELIVRRELAINFVHYRTDYDAYSCLPAWARETLGEHAADERPHVYTRAQLEAAETHDRYWNAAMRELVHTGFMQSYMRMYWGKKILEWGRTPESAFRTALALNNAYFLDGRDANSYVNVAWCFGLHDRGWTERPVFGKVRYMNDRGLERKFDMERYITAVEALVARERAASG